MNSKKIEVLNRALISLILIVGLAVIKLSEKK